MKKIIFTICTFISLTSQSGSDLILADEFEALPLWSDPSSWEVPLNGDSVFILASEYMHDSNDDFVLDIQLSENFKAQVFTSTYGHENYITDGHAQAVLSHQQVIDSSGESYWQDTVNNIVWIKVSFADLVQINPPDLTDIYSEAVLYNEFHLRVWSSDE